MSVIIRGLVPAALVACLLGLGAPSRAGAQAQDAPQAITGTERLAWTQQAFDSEELRQYSYALYVDGAPVILAGAVCGIPSGDVPSARCRSPLPAMVRGLHTLELATRLTVKGVALESARSAPLRVLVDASAMVEPPATEDPADRPVPGGRLPAGSVVAPGLDDPMAPIAPPWGRHAVAEVVATGLDGPTALAALPDGRLLVAERGGWIRVVEDGRLTGPPAAMLADAAQEIPGNWSLAVAPDFAESRHVYLGYPSRGAGGAHMGRVVRFREVGGVLGEAAVILDDLPADAGAPQVKFGPDGALYVATSARDAREAGDLGSYAGKLLRFARDGTTPADNPLRSSPVFSAGLQGIVGFDWDPASRMLWGLQADREGVRLKRLDSAGDGQRDRGAILRADGPDTLRLDGTAAAGAAFHSGSVPASWRGSLFLASPDEECLYRIGGLSSPEIPPTVEKLFCGQFGPIVAVASADDGLYFATASRAGDAGDAGDGARAKAAGTIFRVRDSAPPTSAPAATPKTPNAPSRRTP